MSRKFLVIVAMLFLSTTVASAIDFGAHAGYYANEIKKPEVGVNLTVPIGMFAISPTVDYWKSHGYGYWLGGADVAIRFPRQGVSFWVGAGPTYGYITNYKSSGSGRGYVTTGT